MSAKIKLKSRSEWVEIFSGSDACVSPVLTMEEAQAHPHNLEREAFINIDRDEEVKIMNVRFRTCGDMPITGAVKSDAKNIDDIIKEISTTRITERGSRADDKRGETAMEDRKKQGYF